MCAEREALGDRTRAAEALAAACRGKLTPVSAALAPVLAEPVPTDMLRLARGAERRLGR